ncbi:hypothetical protein FIBSPDRAFT_955276 [Athelia psychrophila]|uniref:Uncharacterized protein n=1 Tax=Athelia psychrophila TaxID=1759441 RepID=A0A166IAG4_9AGAM|nr:hypothetical protein FIBSPDRAFT_955276 [Fibularhizoctonia sp. CBS 109695]
MLVTAPATLSALSFTVKECGLTWSDHCAVALSLAIPVPAAAPAIPAASAVVEDHTPNLALPPSRLDVLLKATLESCLSVAEVSGISADTFQSTHALYAKLLL